MGRKKRYQAPSLSQDEIEDFLDELDVNYDARMDGNLRYSIRLINGLEHAIVEGNFLPPDTVEAYPRLVYGEELLVSYFEIDQYLGEQYFGIDDIEDFKEMVKTFYEIP